MTATDRIRIPGSPGIVKLRQSLLTWYARNKRDLPWRRTRDPYAIMVSEFMLQQTQVATVLPYYRTFLERFPTLDALAKAPETAVRAAWSGLGYYRRARNLQAAACGIVRDHGGNLPDRLDLLQDLPGVGAYTAAALGSIVHAVPKAALDGNVIRVLTRLTSHPGVVNKSGTRRVLQDLADELLDATTPGDWNQAVMELGATVCTPKSPRCSDCPWITGCRAFANGNPEVYPRTYTAPATVAVERAVGILTRDDAVLLVHRRDPTLLDGTWEFPGVDVPSGSNPRACVADYLETLWQRPVRVDREVASIKHSITNRRLVIRGYPVHAKPQPRARKHERAWVNGGSLTDYPISSMTSKLVRALEKTLDSGLYW